MRQWRSVGFGWRSNYLYKMKKEKERSERREPKCRNRKSKSTQTHTHMRNWRNRWRPRLYSKFESSTGRDGKEPKWVAQQAHKQNKGEWRGLLRRKSHRTKIRVQLFTNVLQGENIEGRSSQREFTLPDNRNGFTRGSGDRRAKIVTVQIKKFDLRRDKWNWKSHHGTTKSTDGEKVYWRTKEGRRKGKV